METASQGQFSSSRLSMGCQGVMESLWLTAAGIMPLMFNPRASLATHEAPKLAFLQMLMLLGIAALGVWQVEKHFNHGSAGGSHPMADNRSFWTVLTSFAVFVALSTWFSIDPETSFWGSPEIFQGALSRGAELVLFILIASHLRTREQVGRLVAVILLTSFAVAIYAIMQWLGWDPLHPETRGARASSTMGNPIYLGGYLMMIIPLTLWKILGLKKCKGDDTRQKKMLLTLFVLILCAQVTALALTGSRGSILAAGVSLFTFALLYAALECWKVVLRSLVALTVCVVLAGTAVAWFMQREATAGSPSFSFMGERGDSGRGAMWDKAAEMLLSQSDKVPPALKGDPWQKLRMWIGYGPETLTAALPLHHVVQGSLMLESWFHNIVWDLWWGYGLLGTGAFLTIFGLLFFYAYQRLGWIGSRFDAIVFGGALIVLTLGGALVLRLLFNNPGLAGMGAVLGLAAGLILFPAWHGAANAPRLPFSEPSHGVLVAALAAGLAGYLVSLGFVFPTAASSLLFWIYAGVITVLSKGREGCPAALAAVPPATKKISPALNLPAMAECTFPVPVAIALVTSGVIALLHVCIDPYGDIPHRFSVMALLSAALFNMNSANGPVSLMILPVSLYWFGASLALAATTAVNPSQNEFVKRLGWILGISGVGGLLFALLESFMITRTVPLPEMRILSAAAFDRVHDREVLFFGQTGIIVSLLLLVGWKLSRRTPNQVVGSRPGWAACVMAFIAATVLVRSVVLVPQAAELYVEEGLSLQATGHNSLASVLFKHALSLNPRPFVYRAMLGDSLITEAEATPDPARASQILAEAESMLNDGSQLRPVNRRAYYLGRVYSHWALREAGAARAKLADQAATAFAQARELEPLTETVWTESGLVDLLLRQDAAGGGLKLKRAYELASQAFLECAEFQAGRSLHTRDADMKQQLAEIAGHYFDGAIQYWTLQDTMFAKKVTSRARVNRGLLQLMTNQADAALANLDEAVKLGVEYDQWEIEMLLAEGFLQKADRTAARKHLARSLAIVPPEKTHLLRRLQMELGVQ